MLDVRQVELVSVRVEVPANTPLMLLQEQDGDRRLLPIYIGLPEAAAIQHSVEGITPPRPLTHDLLAEVVDSLSASVERVVVTKVHDHTFFAELHLIAHGRTSVVSCRPSDGVAVAMRVGADLYAAEALLDQVGRLPEPEHEPASADILDEFKDFLQNVSPDDFAT